MKDSRVVIGIHSCKEALKVNSSVQELMVKKDWSRHQDLSEIVQLAKKQRVRVKELQDSQLNTYGASHQGVALTVSDRPRLDWEKLKKAKKATILILDGIVDPHNLGAVLRTGWLMKISGVIIPERNSVGLTSTVSKVACGGAEHVPVEAESNIMQCIKQLKELDFWIYGLSHTATESLGKFELAPKVAWVLGSEQKGARKNILNDCDVLLSIPQCDADASYNASVAAALAMWESNR